MKIALVLPLLLLPALVMLPGAEAAPIRAPEAVTVLQTTNTTLRFTWTLSPDDADPINGTLEYYLVTDGSPSLVAQTPVSGQEGWVYLDLPYTGTTAHDYAIRAINPVDGSTATSCSVYALTEPANNYPAWHDQCGVTEFSPPAGLQATVVEANNPSGPTPATIRLRWRLSVDDPDQYIGELDYEVELCLIGNNNITCLEANDWRAGIDVDGIGDDDGGGFRVYDDTQQDPESGSIFYTYYIRVRQLSTQRLSDWSCPVSVDINRLLAGDSCGNLPNPGGLLGDEPQFPLLDIPVISDRLGIDVTFLGLILIAPAFFGLAFLGYTFAGGAGLGVGAVLGIIAAAGFSLMPAWMVVVIYIVAVLLIFALLRGG